MAARGSLRDKADFISYNKIVYEALHQHHSTEETYLFPAFEEITGIPGFCDRQKKEHLAFDTGAANYYEYVCNVELEDFDSAKFKELMEAFASILQSHLVDEIQMLLDLEKFDSDTISKICKTCTEQIVAHMDPAVLVATHRPSNRRH